MRSHIDIRHFAFVRPATETTNPLHSGRIFYLPQLRHHLSRRQKILPRPWDRLRMTGSATGADARRERGKMPTAASDQVSNDATAPVPPPKFVVYAAVLAVDRREDTFLNPSLFSSLQR